MLQEVFLPHFVFPDFYFTKIKMLVGNNFENCQNHLHFNW